MPGLEITDATADAFLRALKQKPEAVQAAWLELKFSIGKNRWKQLRLIDPPKESLRLYGFPDAGISLDFYVKTIQTKDAKSLTDVLILFWREHDYEFSYSGWTWSAVGRLALSSEKEAKRFLVAYYSPLRQAPRKNKKYLAAIGTAIKLNSKHRDCWIRAIRWAQRYRKIKANRHATTERLLQEYTSSRIDRCSCLSHEWVTQLLDSAAVLDDEPSRVLRNLIAQNHGISESTFTHFRSALKSGTPNDRSRNRGNKSRKILPNPVSSRR